MVRVRHGLRAVRARPLHAGLVVLTFALGIGLNTSILATASQLVMAPLPYPDGDRLVVPWPGRAVPGGLLSGILEESANFDRLALYWDRGSAEYYDPAEPDRGAVGYGVALVSRRYLDLLGLQPVVGRSFRDEDVPPRELRSGVNKVMLTHEAWAERFEADPEVVGRPVRNGPYTTEIVGVMPPEATPLAQGLDGWSVVGFAPDLVDVEGAHFQVVARLASGAGLDRARAELRTRLARADTAGVGRDVILPQWAAPASFGPVSVPVEEQTLVSLRTYLSGNARGGLGLLVVAGLATLLVALVNASALALHRSLERRREVALRRMLGAGRGDILGLVFAEQLVLAALGGAVALGIAWLGSDVLATTLPAGLPHALVDRVGLHAVGWALAGSLLCGVVATGVAVVPLSGEAFAAVDGARGGDGGRTVTAARRSLHGLLAFQVALVTVLMIGAGLLLRTVHNLRSVEPGFATDDVAVIDVRAGGLWQRNPSTPRGEVLDDYFRRVIREVEALSSVEVAGQGAPPFGTPVNAMWEITEGGRAAEPGRPDMEAAWRQVGAGDYFGALGVPLLAGRTLEPEDAPGLYPDLPSTAVVNRLFAERLWPAGGAVGRTFHMTSGTMEPVTLRVVGVVETFRMVSMDQAPVPAFYTRMTPSRSATTPILAKAAGPASTTLPRLEDAVRTVDPRVPVLSVEPFSDVIADSIRDRRSALVLLGGLAGTGLLLGLLGIYGVTALASARRTRELGIRMALGARAPGVVRLLVGQGVAVVAVGVAAGLFVGSWLTPLLRDMLFGVEPVDPVTFGAVPLTVLAAAVLASLLPALRASRLDPSETLRAE